MCKIDISYTYTVEGREYRSNRYQLIVNSSGYDNRKAAIVAHYRPGMTAICYFNPKDPADAVLERGFSPVMPFGLIILPIFLIGLGGVVWVFVDGR